MNTRRTVEIVGSAARTILVTFQLQTIRLETVMSTPCECYPYLHRCTAVESLLRHGLTAGENISNFARS